jgi:hypothetical protein
MQLPVWPSFTTAVRRGLNRSLRLWENTAFTCVGRRCVLGNSLSGIKGDSTVSGSHGIGRLFGLDKPNREPTSGLEPLTCSLRVSLSPTPNYARNGYFAGNCGFYVVHLVPANTAKYRSYC